MTVAVQPPKNSHKALKVGAGVVIVALLVGAVSMVPKSTLSGLAKNNIFALVGSLNGTTGQMLQHTEQLRANVGRVQAQLGQLQQQDAIVQQQQKTGAQLQQQMTTQTQLTQQGVTLMQTLLSEETKLSHATAQVAAQSGQLTGVVQQNANVLQRLLGSLVTSSQESDKLNHQLDLLLAQLGNSVQEFKVFGQVDKLLGSLTGSHSGSGLLSGVGNLLGGGSGGGTKAGSNSASSAPGTNSTVSNTTSGQNSTSNSSGSSNSSGGLLGGLLGNLF